MERLLIRTAELQARSIIYRLRDIFLATNTTSSSSPPSKSSHPSPLQPRRSQRVTPLFRPEDIQIVEFPVEKPHGDDTHTHTHTSTQQPNPTGQPATSPKTTSCLIVRYRETRTVRISVDVRSGRVVVVKGHRPPAFTTGGEEGDLISSSNATTGSSLDLPSLLSSASAIASGLMSEGKSLSLMATGGGVGLHSTSAHNAIGGGGAGGDGIGDSRLLIVEERINRNLHEAVQAMVYLRHATMVDA
ncbi:hypothetical protein HK102_012822, partial [Quaeritorhiza haematococci]